MGIDYDELKARTRAAWSEGNYPEFAKRLGDAARELVDACAISAGQEVLDVAAGTGNVAILAAREGARVVASDLTPALIEHGRARTREDGVEIEWVEADAEALPFDDERFDCVTSVFGAMFAPRPEVVAGELFRVTRPGGTVGMASWTPGSFHGRMFALNARYIPPPEGLPVSVEWGVEEKVEERFGGLAGRVELERRSLVWSYESTEAMLEFLERNAGPAIMARRALPPERYGALQRQLGELIGDHNRADDDSVEIDCEYLLVVARKRG